MTVRRAFAQFRALLHKRRLDHELEGEIEAHLELAQQDARARGLPEHEVLFEARRRFGPLEQIKEEHRHNRSVRWLETLIRDFQYGLRSLVHTPGLALVIVAVLAIGIGATTAMFCVVNAVLLKPLPFQDPDRIVRIWEAPRRGAVNATTVPQFLSWKRTAPFFEALAAEQPVTAALNTKDGAARVPGKLVTAAYFRVFAVGAALGRTFMPEEDEPGAPCVVVLSHGAWQAYFAADGGIFHRRVLLDGESCQVIGILKPGAFDRDRTQFWKALAFSPAQRESDTHWLTVYGRLRAGVSLADARERMQVIYAAVVRNQPPAEQGGAIALETLARLLIGPGLHRSVSVAFGAVLVLLLIACANVANLLLARGATRRTEFAVRAALGASRARLLAQLLTETGSLCVLGGIAGIALAYALIRLATPLLAQSLPFTADVTIDRNVLAFTVAAVLGVLLLSGALPASKTWSRNLADSLKQSARGSSSSQARVRSTIVITELALSLVLVCAALLLVRSLSKLEQVDTGVRIENVITASIDLPPALYPTSRQAALFYTALTERLHSVPQIEDVALSAYLPLEWISNGEAIQFPGLPRLVRVRFKRVDPGYFRSVGIPLLSGRAITDHDREGSPFVVVINQSLARRLAEEVSVKDSIGNVVRLSSTTYDNRQRFLDVRIVGIVRDERTAAPGDADPAVVYVPLAQAPDGHIKLLARTTAQPSSLAPAIREAVRSLDANLALGSVATLEQFRDETLLPASRPAWLMGCFAVIAVLLAAVGLYGLMSHSVTQQVREIGIRMALGARSKDVLAHVLRNALATIAIGLLFGLIGSFALTRVMAGLLFEVSPLDPVALALACLIVVFLGLTASLVPARRAANIDPAATLRDSAW